MHTSCSTCYGDHPRGCPAARLAGLGETDLAKQNLVVIGIAGIGIGAMLVWWFSKPSGMRPNRRKRGRRYRRNTGRAGKYRTSEARLRAKVHELEQLAKAAERAGDYKLAKQLYTAAHKAEGRAGTARRRSYEWED